MAYDQGLAHRVRGAMGEPGGFDERPMFGGLAFLVGGHMCCGVIEDRLVLRLGPDATPEALAGPHTEPMDFTGRVSRTMVYVTPAGVDSDADLAGWVERARRFVETLPPKSRV